MAKTVLTPKSIHCDIRHVVRKALRDSTIGRYDRTHRRRIAARRLGDS